MKAPDKMYYKVLENQYLPTTTDNVSTEGAIEYIRKDALLELIKEETKFWDDGEMIFRGLIDKLNSM